MVRIGPGSGIGGAPGGGDDDGGSGSSSGGSTAPNNDAGRTAPDPVDGGGSSGGTREKTTVDEQTGVLDRLSQRYTETVAEPVGDFTANASPVAGIERATLGTTRTRRLAEGAGEGAAQLGNVPGALAGARDLAKAAGAARSRGFDQVTIGGVPTGVVLPNQEGQQQNARAATGAAASAASNAASNPFRTTGQLIGGAFAGAAGSRAISNVARRTSSGSGAGGSSSGSLGSSPTQALDDFFGDTRATTTGRTRPDSDTDSGTFDGSGVQSGTDFEADLRQQDLTQRQDILRDQASREQSVQRGLVDDPDGGDPIGSGGNGPTFNPDRPDVAGPSRQTTTPGQAVPPEFSGLGRRGNVPTRDLRSTVGTQTAGGSSTGTATGTGAGLGAVSSTTDPTGITDFGGQERGATAGAGLTASDMADQLADQTGVGALGGAGIGPTFTGLDERNDPTGITDTGTDAGADTDTTTGTTGGSSSGAGSTPAPVEVLRSATEIGTRGRTGSVSGSAVGSQTLTDAETASNIGRTDTFAGGRGGFGGGGGGRRARTDGPGAEQREDEAEEFLIGTSADEFGSGILSGSEAAAGLGNGDPFSL